MKTYINYLNESINPNEMTEEEQIRYINDEEDPESIRDIKNPSEKVQLAAIKMNAEALEWIKNPSEKVQLASVRNFAETIQYINDPTEKVQLIAVKKNPLVIAYIKNPSEKVKKYVANNTEFKTLPGDFYDIHFSIISSNEFQQKIKDYITKEIYYKAPKDFPWIPEIKNKFKDIDRFKRFNL